MMTAGKGMLALPADHSEQLSDTISTYDVNRGYYTLLLFLFVLLLFVVVVAGFFCFCFCCFFWDSNMISIDTVEFRYYVVIIILVNLGKP